MSKIFKIFFLFSLSLIILACGKKKDTKPLLNVDLSFMDFVVGGSFAECYESAANNPKIEGLKHKKEGLLDIASFYETLIPDFDNPDKTTPLHLGEIMSFKDTIYSIKYLCFSSGDKILGMYRAKYGTEKTSESVFDDKEYHHISIFHQWFFANGSISIIEKIREPIDPIGSSKHIDDTEVRYYDNRVFHAAYDYEHELNKQKEKQDSLKKVEEEKVRLLKRQEEARIKAEKQQQILDTLRF